MFSPADMAKKQRNPAIRKASEFTPAPKTVKPATVHTYSCPTCLKDWEANKANLSPFCNEACRKTRREQQQKKKEDLKSELKKQGRKPQWCKHCQTNRCLIDSKFCSNECKEIHANSHLSETAQQKNVSKEAEKLERERERKEAVLVEAYRPVVEKKFTPRVTQENLRAVHPREAQRDLFDFLCPTPKKKVYRTMDEAKNFINEVHSEDKFIRPYKCRCGAIHIGH